jgi:hypothetical protein
MRFIPVKTEARQVALSVHRLGVQFMNTRVMKTGEGLLCSALACRRGVAVGGDWVLRAIWKSGPLGAFLSGGVSRLITMAMIGKLLRMQHCEKKSVREIAIARLIKAGAVTRYDPHDGSGTLVGRCPQCLARVSYIGQRPKITVKAKASRHIELVKSSNQEKAMKYQIALALVFAALVAISAPVSAKSALKDAAVGAAVGHVAGHHDVADAAVGAAVGRHRANKANH